MTHNPHVSAVLQLMRSVRHCDFADSPPPSTGQVMRHSNSIQRNGFGKRSPPQRTIPHPNILNTWRHAALNLTSRAGLYCTTAPQDPYRNLRRIEDRYIRSHLLAGRSMVTQPKDSNHASTSRRWTQEVNSHRQEHRHHPLRVRSGVSRARGCVVTRLRGTTQPGACATPRRHCDSSFLAVTSPSMEGKNRTDSQEPSQFDATMYLLGTPAIDNLAPPAGVEPTTYRLGGGRSIH